MEKKNLQLKIKDHWDQFEFMTQKILGSEDFPSNMDYCWFETTTRESGKLRISKN